MLNVTKWDRRFLELAATVATWSKDPSTQVGAVIVRERNQVVSLGYNGFPRGLDDSPERYADAARETIKYPTVIHAEENAIYAARGDVRGCTLYSNVFPCAPCSCRVIQAGINRVVCSWNDKTKRFFEADGGLAADNFAKAGVAVTFYHGDSPLYASDLSAPKAGLGTTPAVEALRQDVLSFQERARSSPSFGRSGMTRCTCSNNFEAAQCTRHCIGGPDSE